VCQKNRPHDIMTHMLKRTVPMTHVISVCVQQGMICLILCIVKSIELQKIKPDLRMFGFNNLSPIGNETLARSMRFLYKIIDDGLNTVL
jgi:hypothetical protein